LIFKEKYHNTSLQAWRKAILKELYLSKIDWAQYYFDGKANRIVIGMNKNIKNYQSQKNKVVSAITKLYIPRKEVIIKPVEAPYALPLIIRG